MGKKKIRRRKTLGTNTYVRTYIIFHSVFLSSPLPAHHSVLYRCAQLNEFNAMQRNQIQLNKFKHNATHPSPPPVYIPFSPTLTRPAPPTLPFVTPGHLVFSSPYSISAPGSSGIRASVLATWMLRLESAVSGMCVPLPWGGRERERISGVVSMLGRRVTVMDERKHVRFSDRRKERKKPKKNIPMRPSSSTAPSEKVPHTPTPDSPGPPQK